MQVRIRNLDFDTTPCVLHHNGGDSICSYGLELKRRFFDLIGEPEHDFAFNKSGKLVDFRRYRKPQPRLPLEPIPDLTVVAFTNFRFPGSAELSLNAVGVPIDVVRPSGTWRNIRRIRLLRDYLDGVKTSHVLTVDTHDVFVTSDIRGIVDGFRKRGCRALFQGEAQDWPPAPEVQEFFDSVAPPDATFRYLCAGIILGETSFLKRLLDRALVTEPITPNSDQGIFRKVFREFHPEAQLDYHCELFQPLTDYRHAKHPDRFEPVDFHLELQHRIDNDDVPAARKLTREKVVRGFSYRLRRAIDARRP